MSNEEVLRKIGTAKKLIVTIRKRQMEFLEHMRKQGLENSTLTRYTEGKRSKVKQCITISGLCEWIADEG